MERWEHSKGVAREISFAKKLRLPIEMVGPPDLSNDLIGHSQRKER